MRYSGQGLCPSWETLLHVHGCSAHPGDVMLGSSGPGRGQTPLQVESRTSVASLFLMSNKSAE